MQTPRRPARPARAPDEAAEPAPPRPRRMRPAPRKSPVVPLAAGGALLLVAVIGFVVMRGGSGETPPAAPGTNAPGVEPTSAPVAVPGSGAAAAVPAPSAPAAPAAPKLDPAAVAAQLAAITTAEAALALGDQALADTGDAALADGCYRKALELEPSSAAARRKLDVRPIDAQTDFPGLEEIQGTAQTYLLRDFLALDGKEMSRGERAREVARWREHRKVVEARMAEAADDPFLDKIDRTRNFLQHQAYFATLQYDVIESTRPYALFVEVKGESVTERDERRQQLEEAYAPFLAAYDRTIHEYLIPLSPAPPATDPPFIVFILLDRASYDRYFLEFEGRPGAPGMRAHYQWVQKWAFTYSPDVKNRKSAEFGEGTQSLLHEITHAWVDRLARDDTGAIVGSNVVQTHWFSEGIAEFMSCHFLDGDVVRFQPWKTMRMAELGARPPGIRIPLKQGFKIGRHDGLEAEAWRIGRDQKAGENAIEPGRAAGICMSGFYADMSLFIFWLNYANGGRYKRTFEDYVRKELSGRGGPEVAERVFAEVFAMEDLEQAIDEFQKAVASKKVTFEDRDLVPEK